MTRGTVKAKRSRMPVLFIGHGSPMNIVLDNAFTRSLRELGRVLPRPRAILVVSAHWLTRGTFVTCAAQPEQIYDFAGFPKELYEMRYPAPGSPAEGKKIAAAGMGFPVSCSEDWGLDHASWAVLVHLFPAADIPVLELSLDISRPERDHLRLARGLAPLRDDGILIIGSGNIVHNLGAMVWDMDASFDWAMRFDEDVKACLESGDRERLAEYRSAFRDAGLAVPTNDHYLPLLYAAALRDDDEQLSFTYEGIQHGSVSMRCFRIG
jgi:4,5-DOPA dioxygenase extradiol